MLPLCRRWRDSIDRAPPARSLHAPSEITRPGDFSITTLIWYSFPASIDLNLLSSAEKYVVNFWSSRKNLGTSPRKLCIASSKFIFFLNIQTANGVSLPSGSSVGSARYILVSVNLSIDGELYAASAWLWPPWPVGASYIVGGRFLVKSTRVSKGSLMSGLSRYPNVAIPDPVPHWYLVGSDVHIAQSTATPLFIELKKIPGDIKGRRIHCRYSELPGGIV